MIEYNIAGVQPSQQDPVLIGIGRRRSSVGEYDVKFSFLAHASANIEIHDLDNVDHHQHQHYGSEKNVRRDP